MRISTFLLATSIAVTTLACSEPIEEIEDFESFRIEFTAGLCPPGGDCDSFVQIEFDGRLQYDALGEGPVVVHEAYITPEEYDELLPVLIGDPLMDLMRTEVDLCQPPTDIFESMRMVADGVTYQQTTTGCEQAPLVDIRDRLGSLTAAYFP